MTARVMQAGSGSTRRSFQDARSPAAFNLSDNKLELQVYDRRSFEEFVGLGVMNAIPDATTICLFRERLRRAEIFEMFETFILSQDFQALGGQITDATLVPVPKQRNSSEANKDIKAGRHPAGWEDNPDRLQQRDLDAHWVKKNGVSHYGYQKSICIDADHDFIRRYLVTPANVNDSQVVPSLLDPEKEHDFGCADSAYSAECFEELLSLGGFEGLIHQKGAFNHLFSDAAKDLNRIKFTISACIEHACGGMTMFMGRKLTGKIGLGRIKAWWNLKNPPYTFFYFFSTSPKLTGFHESGLNDDLFEPL